MVNIYSELKLDPSASLPELQSELYHQEKVWRKREIYSSEAATAKLALINEAKKIFASSSSKAEYDRELEDNKREVVVSDPQEEQYNQWRYWYDEAYEYLLNKQYDLAKSAIEESFKYYLSDFSSSDFLKDAAVIYMENGDFSLAIKYINDAIVINPGSALLQISKGIIYRRWYEKEKTRNPDAPKLLQKERDAYKLAISKAEDNKDIENKAYALAALAYSYYCVLETESKSTTLGNPTNEEVLAKRYAIDAANLGNHSKLITLILDGIASIEDTRRNNTFEAQYHARVHAKKVKIQQGKRAEEKRKETYAFLKTFDKTKVYAKMLLSVEKENLLREAVALIPDESWERPFSQFSSSYFFLSDWIDDRNKGLSFHYTGPSNTFRIELPDSRILVFDLDFKASPSQSITNMQSLFRQKEKCAKKMTETAHSLEMTISGNQRYVTWEEEYTRYSDGIENSATFTFVLYDDCELYATISGYGIYESDLKMMIDKKLKEYLFDMVELYTADDGKNRYIKLKNKMDENKMVEEKILKAMREDRGLCAFCGGKFGGIFKNKCTNCGKLKSY